MSGPTHAFSHGILSMTLSWALLFFPFYMQGIKSHRRSNLLEIVQLEGSGTCLKLSSVSELHAFNHCTVWPYLTSCRTLLTQFQS